MGMTNSSIQLNVRCKLIFLSVDYSGDESELKPSIVLQVADGPVTRLLQKILSDNHREMAVHDLRRHCLVEIGALHNNKCTGVHSIEVY